MGQCRVLSYCYYSSSINDCYNYYKFSPTATTPSDNERERVRWCASSISDVTEGCISHAGFLYAKALLH